MTNPMHHDADVGLKFLRWLYPQGPWLMTAINVDQTETPSRTFFPHQQDEFSNWLRHYDGFNIYYSVNKPTRAMNKKAERTDIGEMWFTHVDVDPRSKENFDLEKERILKLLCEKYAEKGLPKPSAIVFSGGGYNALWRLQEPIVIAEDGVPLKEIEARYENAKRYNLQLEILLGGDNCHNVDRILRLPGSVNRLNKKKLAKGRVQCQAEIVYLDSSTYPLSSFMAAPPVQQRGGGGFSSSGGGVGVSISGNVKRLGSVEELGEKVPQRLKMIIVQGYDPDEPNKFGTSRSEWLFYVVCGLVRAGCTDDEIYSVITDEGFKISASILDKGSTIERYATRQIQRAREQAIDPYLRELNEKHAVIANTGGRCRVVQELMDDSLGRTRLTMQTFEDFRNRYMAKKIKIGEHPKSGETMWMEAGQWWLKNENRRQYETIAFAPNRDVPDVYNLWTGFSCEAVPGNMHESFLSHIKDVICGGVDQYYEYLVKWMARAVQRPDAQGETCVVFRGEMGAGKGTVATEFGRLWGRHFLQISDPKHLVGSFNAHLRDAVVVFADEAFYAGDKKHESILKTLITEERLILEGKGKDAETGRNYVHLMMASNAQWVVPVQGMDRRFFVLDVVRSRVKDFEYFKKMRADLENGGRQNLLHYLLTLDIRDWDHRQIPQTDALREQKMLTFSPEQEWWYRKLDDGMLMRGHSHWQKPVFCDDLLDDYLLYSQRVGVSRRSGATGIGRFLKSIVPSGLRRTQLIRKAPNKDGITISSREYAYEFPALQACRELFDQKFGGPYPWTPEPDLPNGAVQDDAFGPDQRD